MALESRKAIVTGASSGIGKAIAEMLFAQGFEVFGLGRSFGETGFTAIQFDITDTARLAAEVDKIGPVDVLVNCAGSAYYGVHGSIDANNIEEMCRIDLEVPMVLTRLVLPGLRQRAGHVINIASVTAARINTHAAAYGALKAGLLSFGRSVFEEERKNNVKVTTILPDLTDTALYRNADFRPGEGSLAPEDIADAVRFVLESRCVVTELEIRPQQNKIERKSQT